MFDLVIFFNNIELELTKIVTIQLILKLDRSGLVLKQDNNTIWTLGSGNWCINSEQGMFFESFG